MDNNGANIFKNNFHHMRFVVMNKFQILDY